MNVVDRAEMCRLQAQQLYEDVNGYEKARVLDEFVAAGYATPKNGQKNKTAIKRQITSLRQSLLALEKEVTR